MPLVTRIALCCLLTTCCMSAECSELEGTVFNLPDPNLSRITDQEVIVNVFKALTQGGRLVRDADTGQLIKSGPRIASGSSNLSDGSYIVEDMPDEPTTVIVEFNRSGEAVTERIEGVVASNAKALVIDAIVPKQSQMSNHKHCHRHYAPHKCCKLRRKCRR